MSTGRLRRIISILGIGALLLPMLSLLVQPTTVAQAQTNFDKGTAPTATADYYWHKSVIDALGGVTPPTNVTPLGYFYNTTDNTYYVGLSDLLTSTSADAASQSGTAAANGVLANDTDPDSGTQLSVDLSGSDPKIKYNGQVMTEDDFAAGEVVMGIQKTTKQGGTVALFWNGAFIYTPPENWQGVDSFSYKVTDGVFVSSDAAEVRIESAYNNNAQTNDLPTANPDFVHTAKNQKVTWNVLWNDKDDVAYTVPSYKARKASTVNGKSAQSMMRITGYASGHTDYNTTTKTGTPGTTVGTELTVTGNSAAGATNADAGRLTISENGEAVFTPTSNFTGVAVITYYVSDGFSANGGVWSTMAITVYDGEQPKAKGNASAYEVYQDQTLWVTDGKTSDNTTGGTPATECDPASSTKPCGNKAKTPNTKMYFAADTDSTGTFIDGTKGGEYEFRVVSLPEKGYIYRTMPRFTVDDGAGTPGGNKFAVYKGGHIPSTTGAVKTTSTATGMTANTASEIIYTCYSTAGAVADDIPCLDGGQYNGGFKYVPKPLTSAAETTDTFDYVFATLNGANVVGFSNVGTVNIKTMPMNNNGAPVANADSYTTDPGVEIQVMGGRGYRSNDDKIKGNKPILFNDKGVANTTIGGSTWTAPLAPFDAHENQLYIVEVTSLPMYGTLKNCNTTLGTFTKAHLDEVDTGGNILGYTDAKDVVASAANPWFSDGCFIYQPSADAPGQTDTFTYRFRHMQHTLAGATSYSVFDQGQYNTDKLLDAPESWMDWTKNSDDRDMRDFYSNEGTVSVTVNALSTTSYVAEDDEYGKDPDNYALVYQDVGLTLPAPDPDGDGRLKAHPTLLDNDTPSSNAVSMQLKERPQEGILSQLSNQGTFIYTPFRGVVGVEDTFRYRFEQQAGYSTPEEGALVTIKISAFDQAPYAGNDTYQIDSNSKVDAKETPTGVQQKALLDNDTGAPAD